MLILLLSCASKSPPAAPAVEITPVTIVLVRHAEKRTDEEDPRLTDRGIRRAECLSALLGPTKPTFLLSSDRRRTQLTLTPLAESLSAEIQVRPAGDIEAFVADLGALDPGARAVVAGHSNTVPAIVAGLGGELEDLNDKGWIPDDEYSRLITVTRVGETVKTEAQPYCED